jgi:flagellar secretion chaperone FliS
MNATFSYREAAVRGASPVRLVICLYQQAIEDLRRAMLAFEKRDIEARTRAINHALTVIGQLQGTLDMQRGGDVAKNLDRFYAIVRAGLIDAQVKQSAAIVERQIAQLVLVHDAWLEVERVSSTSPEPDPDLQPVLPPVSPSVSPSEARAGDWTA